MDKFKFHLIGIKGTGMSALAQVLHDLGHDVQGSDKSTTFYTQKALEHHGIPLMGFSKENIKDTLTAVIASAAFGVKNEEIEECLKRDIPIVGYHQFLGKLIEPYTSIAISGTHGKTFDKQKETPYVCRAYSVG